jgi:predicted nucleic acid-binding protein
MTISFAQRLFLAAGIYGMGLSRSLGQNTLRPPRILAKRLDIIPSSRDRWGAVRFERRKQPISVADAWVAASALVHGYDLVTHNAPDVQGIRGLTIVSEPA